MWIQSAGLSYRKFWNKLGHLIIVFSWFVLYNIHLPGLKWLDICLSITLQRGSKQGCPPSLLCFSIYRESIKGIHINGEEHKVALSVDDVLVHKNIHVSLIKHFPLVTKCIRYNLTLNYKPLKQLNGSAFSEMFGYLFAKRHLSIGRS